jgi:hypothetical protein
MMMNASNENRPPDYSGMTVNERLFAAGLVDAGRLAPTLDDSRLTAPRAGLYSGYENSGVRSRRRF